MRKLLIFTFLQLFFLNVYALTSINNLEQAQDFAIKKYPTKYTDSSYPSTVEFKDKDNKIWYLTYMYAFDADGDYILEDEVLLDPATLNYYPEVETLNDLKVSGIWKQIFAKLPPVLFEEGTNKVKKTTAEQAVAVAMQTFLLQSDVSVYKQSLIRESVTKLQYYIIDFVTFDKFSNKTFFVRRAVVAASGGAVITDDDTLAKLNALLGYTPDDFDPLTKELKKQNLDTLSPTPVSDAKHVFGSVYGYLALIFLIALTFFIRKHKFTLAPTKIVNYSYGAVILVNVLLGIYYFRYASNMSNMSIWFFLGALGTVSSWAMTKSYSTTNDIDDSNEETIDMSKVKKISWDEMILQPEVKKDLQRILRFVENPEMTKNLGIEPPKGVLLYGPPGTGKTTIARTLANEAHASFFSISGADIYSKWIGESENKIKNLFSSARKNKPSIIFIDEIDSIISKRGGDSVGGIYDKITNQVLQEIDGIVDSSNVFILGATNNPKNIDQALLRGGRLAIQIEIPLPGKDERVKLFNLYLKNKPVGEGINYEELSEKSDGFSGADIKDICDNSVMVKFDENTEAEFKLTQEDILNSMVSYHKNSSIYEVPDYFKKKVV